MYKLVALAGTFDHLHKGHLFFISEAFRLGEKVLIGLTSDEFAREKLSAKAESGKDTSDGGRLQASSEVEGSVNPKIEGFEKRRRQLENFLKERDFFHRAKIIKIDDLYGPAIQNNEIEALVVTRETYKGGKLVNKKRQELSLNPLKILQVPQVLAQDQRRIASTRIRLGEIDRWGKVYKFQISEGLRQELKKPLGVLTKGEVNNHHKVMPKLSKLIDKVRPVMIITVGDEVTKLCNESGILIDLAIIDYKVGRKKIYKSLADLGFYILFFRGREKIVYNPPGFIKIGLINAVEKAIRRYLVTGQQEIVRVKGEEDLAGVPAVLLAPLGSLIFYGQPGEGIVMVEVTEEKKNQLLNILII